MSANATMHVEMSPEFLFFFLGIVETILQIYAQNAKRGRKTCRVLHSGFSFRR
jgi:hypothetical protein